MTRLLTIASSLICFCLLVCGSTVNASSSPLSNSVIQGKILEVNKEERMIQIRNWIFIVEAVEWLLTNEERNQASFLNLEEGLQVYVEPGDLIEGTTYKATLVTIPENQDGLDLESDGGETSVSSQTNQPQSSTDNSYTQPTTDENAPVLEDGVWKN